MKKLIALALAAAFAVTALAIPAFAASSKTARVKLVDDKFVPKKLTVRKGTTVKFTWAGKQPHNVTVSKGPARFRSSTKLKGTFSKKLTHKGTYTILCTIHAPDMKMTIKVD